MISVEEALANCLSLVTPLETELIALRHACGRMMPNAAIAARDQPPFPASAMDGYAIAADPAPGDTFAVIGQSAAGHAFQGSVEAGQAIRIFTGAPVPQGATRVVIQEDVEAKDSIITIKPNADTSRHIRPQGQDFKAGQELSPRLLRPNDLALLAAMNVGQITVTRRPIVALIATGDELVMPGDQPNPDQIIASNTFALAALAEATGAIARILPIAPDREADLRHILTLTEGADLIVTIGGASVGDHDLVAKVAADMGLERAFWKIAMRPGKPLMAGCLNGIPMLGLPGNPVSSIVCAHLFMLPMLRAMQSYLVNTPDPRRATLATDVDATGPRAHYMRARLTQTDGLPQITPFDRQDSALLKLLSDADALLIRPLGDGPRRAGDSVTYLPI